VNEPSAADFSWLQQAGVISDLCICWEDVADRRKLLLCLENPVGAIGTTFRPADQYVNPWQFGDDASKKTGFWLRGRVRFYHVDGRRGGAAPAPSVLVAYGDRAAARLAAADCLGGFSIALRAAGPPF